MLKKYIEKVMPRIGLVLMLLAGFFPGFPHNVSRLHADPFSTLTRPSSSLPDGLISVEDLTALPALEDWQAGIPAFSHGARGQWDAILWGGFANSLIKKGNTYYLYYQGSSSYNEQCASVSRRAIGVATSTDGFHWTKSPQNPVITWSSQGSIEEGAVSSAAWLGADGKTYVYYGANTGTNCAVRSNPRLAVSSDGIHFDDLGEVLSSSNPDVWGAGDELFPVGTYSYQDKWYLYYIPNGVSISRKLGVGIGSSPTGFSQTRGLNNSTVAAWGPVSVILGGTNSVLITNPNGPSGPINLYKFDAANPSVVRLQNSYRLPDCAQASVIYESSSDRWMMSCRDHNSNRYLIKFAYTTHTFADVPASYWAWEYIEALYEAGITTGCVSQSPMKYCPNALVTRADMATFIERAMGNFNPNPNPTGMFADVPYPGLEHLTPFIEEFYNDGITTGCTDDPLKFCPGNTVTRAEMATFIQRALGNFNPNPNPDGMFADVPYPGLEHLTPFIEEFYNDGITTGCAVSPLRYCPANKVTRAEMAVFIVRAFNIPLP